MARVLASGRYAVRELPQQYNCHFEHQRSAVAAVAAGVRIIHFWNDEEDRFATYR